MDRILLIDNDPHFRTLLQSSLPEFGLQVETAENLAEAARIGHERSFHVVAIASKLSDADAHSVIQWVEREQPAAAVVVLVSAGDEPRPSAVLAASDAILLKSRLADGYAANVLLAVLERRRTFREYGQLRRQRERERLTTIIDAVDPAGKDLAGKLLTAASATFPVLLCGERGSMSELLAYTIHYLSSAKAGPFAVTVARPGSALFGTETPEFEMGPIESAHGGTLFVDNIWQLPAEDQEQLTGFLQTGTFLRHGGSRKVNARVRLIAAGSCSPGSGHLHALSDHPIEIPPLRARRDDIIPLAQEFLAVAAERRGKEKPALTANAESALFHYQWPGNIEELKAVMERAALLCDREITLSGLNLDLAARGESSWKDIERVAIEEALRSNGGNRAKAAKQLGMSLRKLHYRLRDYGIRRQRPLD